MLSSQLKVMAVMTVTVATAVLCAGVAGVAQPLQGANLQKGSGGAAAKDDPFAPMVKIQDDDYAKVRVASAENVTESDSRCHSSSGMGPWPSCARPLRAVSPWLRAV